MREVIESAKRSDDSFNHCCGIHAHDDSGRHRHELELHYDGFQRGEENE